ncbi:MAG: carboxypeptidase-like regulatory domain-containing protein [Bryobacteraceae bacterium]
MSRTYPVAYKRAACLAAVALFTFGLAPGGAQINTGRITGTVTDSSGGAVPDVAIKATNLGTGVVTRASSNASGEYLINFLVPGQYRVEAERSGFQRFLSTGVTVNAGGVERVDISMLVGEMRQTVEVAASTISVDTETSELSQTFTHKQLDALPNIDQNPLYQMNLMPGANNGRGSGNYGNNGGENGSSVGNSRNQIASIGGVDANATTSSIQIGKRTRAL